jgi:hypothetical protein
MTRTIENFRESQLSGDTHFGLLVNVLLELHAEQGLLSARQAQAQFEARSGQFPSIDSHVNAAEIMTAFNASKTRPE